MVCFCLPRELQDTSGKFLDLQIPYLSGFILCFLFFLEYNFILCCLLWCFAVLILRINLWSKGCYVCPLPGAFAVRISIPVVAGSFRLQRFYNFPLWSFGDVSRCTSIYRVLFGQFAPSFLPSFLKDIAFSL